MAYTTIDDPEAYFQVEIYEGTGSSHARTLDGDTDLSPNLVICKGRASTSSTSFFDTVRGVTKQLRASRSSNEAEATTAETLKSFDSDGFTMGTDGDVNYDGDDYVAWCFKESATAGFDILVYDGVGTGTAQNVSHSLSATPEFYTVKSRESVGNWQTYHHKMSSAPETDYVQIDSTEAVADYTFWGDTAPTSSVFTVDDGNDVNESGESFLCYLWRSVQGFSKFGVYASNSNANGPFVYLGFRPALLWIKNVADGGAAWFAFDNKRSPTNIMNEQLLINSTATETTGSTNNIDFLSNGFKCKTSNGDTNGGTHIYMAWAESPFVNSNGVPNNAR